MADTIPASCHRRYPSWKRWQPSCSPISGCATVPSARPSTFSPKPRGLQVVPLPMSASPRVYILFGIPHSERRSTLYDLIENGLPEGTQALYFKTQDEPSDPIDASITSLEHLQTITWKLCDGKVQHERIKPPLKPSFLTPGDADPAEAAEAIKAWANNNDCQIARCITLVHCDFLQENQRPNHGLKPAFISQTSSCSPNANIPPKNGSRILKPNINKTTSPVVLNSSKRVDPQTLAKFWNRKHVDSPFSLMNSFRSKKMHLKTTSPKTANPINTLNALKAGVAPVRFPIFVNGFSHKYRPTNAHHHSHYLGSTL